MSAASESRNSFMHVQLLQLDIFYFCVIINIPHQKKIPIGKMVL